MRLIEIILIAVVVLGDTCRSDDTLNACSDSNDTDRYINFN